MERNDLIDKLGLELDFNENETKYNELLKELESMKLYDVCFWDDIVLGYVPEDEGHAKTNILGFELGVLYNEK